MSMPGSIYVISMRLIFHYRYLFFGVALVAHVLKYACYFFSIATDNVIKMWLAKVNILQIARVQPHGVTQHLLNF